MKCELNAKLLAELQLPVDRGEQVYWDIRQPGLGLRLRRGAGGDVLRSWVVLRKKDRVAHKVKLGNAREIGIESARAAA